MRRFFTFLIIFLMISMIFSCSDNQKISISCNFSEGGTKNLKLYKITPTETIFTDTLKLDESGTFLFEDKIPEITLYRINESDLNFFFLLVEPGESIKITGQIRDLASTYKPEGSYQSSLLREYMQQFNFAYKEKIKIAESARFRLESGDSIHIVKQDAIKRHNQVKKEIVDFTREYIRKNKCSLTSVIVLDLQLGKNDPILSIENDYEYFAMVDSCLSEQYPHHTFAQEFNRVVIEFDQKKKSQENQTLKIGTKAPNITMRSSNGDTINLYDNIDETTLVYFWASWNKQSRLFNNDVQKIYEKYHKRGLSIFQVSLDKSEDKWLQAIETDKLFWPQVCDLKFWDSYVINLYQVYNVPSYYILDKNGIITDINVEIDYLQKRLAEIFK